MMRFLVGMGTLAAVSFACTSVPETSGRATYETYCASCHGTDGRGDGPRAAEVGRPVPDLTLIAVRAGGSFPTAEVMSTIDGYSRGQRGDLAMPEFGAELSDGDTILVDTGDGVLTPTPRWLWSLADYLRSIQRQGA